MTSASMKLQNTKVAKMQARGQQNQNPNIPSTTTSGIDHIETVLEIGKDKRNYKSNKRKRGSGPSNASQTHSAGLSTTTTAPITVPI